MGWLICVKLDWGFKSEKNTLLKERATVIAEMLGPKQKSGL